MDKKALSERDICSKFITPAICAAGWDIQRQIREEVGFTKGRIIVRGKLHTRGEQKRADYVLYHKSNIPLAVIEAKDNKHTVGAGMQQALNYAETLGIPFVFSSNGDGFLMHDRTGLASKVETELSLDSFPSPEELWSRYCDWKGLDTPDAIQTVEMPYYDDGSGRAPRYYQASAINNTIEAVAKGQPRVLLVMATGTGKTYTAFQIIWRLWKSGAKKRILFLGDRNILVDQTKNNDFKPFGAAMTKISKRQIDKSYEIYLSLYQAVTGVEEEKNIYKQFSPDFFDLIVVDECHRGSAAEDSAWRDILDYFSTATHVGLTATPKETKDVSSITYFGEPVYSYTLKQGIEDGFLAPYKVVRIDLDKDLQGWRPTAGQTDKTGQLIEDRIFNLRDMDRTLVLEKRTELVAKKITQFLQGTDPYAKTIVFCDDIDHAERMRQALVNLNPGEVKKNRKYIMRITGDEQEGKAELDNFINPEERYPVIATTSKLMTTGVDAQTCKLVVLDQHIKSMTEFKQIIGRGTRINEDYGKFWFTIMDFKKATELFADKDFDGDPVVIYAPSGDDSPIPPDDLSAYLTDPIDVPFPTSGPDDIHITGFSEPERRARFVVSDVEVKVTGERVQYYSPDGRLITESLKDYPLPESWEWIRVSDAAELITSGSRDWSQYLSNDGAKFVTMGNLSRGQYSLRLDSMRYVKPPIGGESARTKLQEFDLLISITGDVGNLGLIPANFGEAYINQHTCLLRFLPACRNRFFPEALRAPLATSQFTAPQRGIKNSFRLGDVDEILLPLPPLAEQKRIVTKIDELMAICDKLKSQLRAANQLQQKLADALVEQAVA